MLEDYGGGVLSPLARIQNGGSIVRIRTRLAGLWVGACLALAASCSDDVPPSLVTPCAGALQGKCGTTCAVDAQCAQGTYCASNGCTADCTPMGNECGANARCLSNGRCQPSIDLDGSAGSAGGGDGSVRDGCVNV